MPRNTQKKFPIASSFQLAVNRGTPVSNAAANIAKRTGCDPGHDDVVQNAIAVVA